MNSTLEKTKTINLLKGKKGIVMGVANNQSIAWGISQMASSFGASLAFSYQNAFVKRHTNELYEKLNCKRMVCDVTKEGSVKSFIDEVKNEMGNIDFIVHSLAFSDKNELTGKYYNTSRKNFLNAMNISCYSFTEICREAVSILNKEASLLTITYLGGERVIPNYNVMGVCKAALESSVRYLANDLGEKSIRVNAISAGPIKTLSANAIDDFNKFLTIEEKVSPLKRNVTKEDVGSLACFLMSDLSRNITGQTIYVDSGYNIMGMMQEV